MSIIKYFRCIIHGWDFTKNSIEIAMTKPMNKIIINIPRPNYLIIKNLIYTENVIFDGLFVKNKDDICEISYLIGVDYCQKDMTIIARKLAVTR